MKILFLCTGNSCRSQIAEGYAHQLGNEGWEVKSAGIKANGLNSLAVTVMKEDDVDISAQPSTVLTEDLLKWADLVITLCGDANDNCPMLPKNTQKKYWPFEDPAKMSGSETEIMTKFREIRDGIKKQIITLVDELKPRRRSSLTP